MPASLIPEIPNLHVCIPPEVNTQEARRALMELIMNIGPHSRISS